MTNKTSSKIKYVVFDFDGTIAQSLPLILKIYNRSYAKRYKLPQVKNPEKIRDLSLKELKRMTHLSFFKIFFIMRRIKNQFGDDIDDLKIKKGIKEVIQELSKKYTLGIVSTNSEKNISIFLKKHKIDNKFKFIYAADTFSQKYGVLKKAMEKFRLNNKNTIYIGDEVQDIIAGRKLKINLISVLWGINSEKLLKKEKPDFIARKPKDIVTFLKKMK